MKPLSRILLTLLVAGLGHTVPAHANTPLEVIVFPGGFNWPIWVAQDKNYFKQQGIEVKVTPTPSSSYQLTNLIDGKYDIAMTAVDNLIAYREGQGEVVEKVGADLVAVMGADQGFLKLVSVPEVHSIQDLKGRTVSVDARNTGYALVLFELLERAGLKEPDFTAERAGGVRQRFEALMKKEHAATMLISPFEVQPVAQGYHVLATASEALGAYQGVVAGVRQSWARENREALTAYIRAYVQAVDWLHEPANRDEALRIFQHNMQNATPESAAMAYRLLLDPQTGFQKRAAISMEGLTQVLKLRSKWGIPQRNLSQAEQYYDGSFYEAALKP